MEFKYIVYTVASSSTEVILLSMFVCQSSFCGCKGKPLMCPACIQHGSLEKRLSGYTVSQNETVGKVDSGQMACLNLRCPHCGKDDQLWKRQGWAIKCVTIWLHFIFSMENYVVSSPQALWDFVWVWPPWRHPSNMSNFNCLIVCDANILQQLRYRQTFSNTGCVWVCLRLRTQMLLLAEQGHYLEQIRITLDV